MNNQRWFYCGLLLLLFGIIPLSYISVTSLRSVNAERTELTEKYARALAVTNHLRFNQSHESGLVLKYILSGDPKIMKQIEKSRLEFDEHVKDLKKIDPTPEALRIINEIAKNKNELVSAIRPIWTLKKNNHSIEKLNAFLENNTMVFNTKIVKLIDDYFKYEIERMGKTRENVDRLTARQDHALLLTSIFTCVGFLMIVMLLFRLGESSRAYQKAREELYHQIEKTAKIRKDVLESVSHDLKNPIATVQLGTQMLSRLMLQTDQGEKALQYLHRIENSTKMMKNLINDLLDSAKADSGNLELELISESPLEIAQEALEGIANLAEVKNIRLEMECAPLFHEILCDRKRLHQVFSNLLGNSLKFTPEGGRISLSIYEEDDKTCFLISDTGKGISADHIPHLFDRFWQADKKGNAGTGIGLSIVKAIVEKHGGMVAVKSIEGAGSSFIFSIPFSSKQIDLIVPSSDFQKFNLENQI